MLIVAIVAPITVSILLFVVGCCFLRLRAKNRYSAVKEDSGITIYSCLIVVVEFKWIDFLNFGYDLLCAVVNEMTTVESLQFDFKTIEAATNKFSEENRLGEGGFGAVFKVSKQLPKPLFLRN